MITDRKLGNRPVLSISDISALDVNFYFSDPISGTTATDHHIFATSIWSHQVKRAVSGGGVKETMISK